MTSINHRRPLPILPTVRLAYAQWLRGLPEVLPTVLVWIAVSALPLVALQWLQQPLEVQQRASLLAKEMMLAPPLLLLLRFGASVVLAPMFAAVAVAWHRKLLRGRPPEAARSLRLDRSTLAYAALLVVLQAGTMIAVSLYAVIPTLQNEGPGLVLLAALACPTMMVASVVVALRLNVFLPALAISRQDVTMGHVWARTRGHGMSLMVGQILASVLTVVVSARLTMERFAPDSTRLGGALWASAGTLSAVILGLVEVGFLSLAYQYLFEPVAED